MTAPRRPWAVVGLVAGTLLVAAVVPIPPAAGAGTGLLRLDWLLHGLGYALLAATLRRALLATGRGGQQALLLAIVLAVGYGLALELLQLAIPTRGFSGWDLLADAVGALGGALVALGRDRAWRR